MNKLSKLQTELVEREIVDLDEDFQVWDDHTGMLHVRLYRDKEFYYGHARTIDGVCDDLKKRVS